MYNDIFSLLHLIPCNFPLNFNCLWKNFLQMPNYVVHFGTSMVCQDCFMSSISWSLVFFLDFLFRNFFSSCHIFSMGLQFGDSGGVLHQFIPCSSKKVTTTLDVYLGLLSWNGQLDSWWTSRMKEQTFFFNMSVYMAASMLCKDQYIFVGWFLSTRGPLLGVFLWNNARR